jgi:hypothetical protein
MKFKLFTALVLALVGQLSALAISGPHVTFDCYKSPNSTNTLKLTMRNNGPDTVAQGTALYYFYYTSAHSSVQTHVFHAATELRKGAIFDVLVPAPAGTSVNRCGCSLTPIRVRPEAAPYPPERSTQ